MLKFDLKDATLWEKENGSTRLEKSGCIDSTVTEIKIVNSKSSEAAGILFKFESIEGTYHSTIWFQDKTGSETFGKRIIGSACVLCKTEDVKDLKGKKVGVFVKREIDKNNFDDYGNNQINFVIEGFYNIDKKSTLHELMNGKEPQKYNQMQEKYKKEIKEEPKKNTQNKIVVEEDNSDFPF